MAQRIALRYCPGSSLLHRWDARCKFLGLVMMTATLLHLKISWLAFDSAILLGLLILSKLPIRQFLRDIQLWGIFLLILFLFHALFTPGPHLSALSWFPVSETGLSLGILTCWRLGLILGYAVLFTAITRPRELRDALIWFLRPVPLLPERRIGLMVSLTLRFFSLILDQVEEVRLAYKARLGDHQKNPFRKAKCIALPLLRRSFSRAEDITLALASRGYRDDVPLHLPQWNKSHVIPLLIFLGCIIILWKVHF
jgi:biotin transport system permease protein